MMFPSVEPPPRAPEAPLLPQVERESLTFREELDTIHAKQKYHSDRVNRCFDRTNMQLDVMKAMDDRVCALAADLARTAECINKVAQATDFALAQVEAILKHLKGQRDGTQ